MAGTSFLSLQSPVSSCCRIASKFPGVRSTGRMQCCPLSSCTWVSADVPVLSGLGRRVWLGAVCPPPCLTTVPFRMASSPCSSCVPSLNHSGTLGHWLGPWHMPVFSPGRGCKPVFSDDLSQWGDPAVPSPIALGYFVGPGTPRI